MMRSNDWRRCDKCGGWTQQPHLCLGCLARIQIGMDAANRLQPGVGGPMDGADEFDIFLAWVRRLPEHAPRVRWWSGTCLWCAREIREQSGDEQTHMPVFSTIQTCYRHRKALLALSRWQRNEKFGGDAA